MTFPIHSFRDLRRSTLSLILLAAFAGIAGCGSDNSPDSMVSPPGWVVVPSGGQHAKSATLTYIDNGGITSCAECHGADLSGGTSKVSCFGNPSGCHHGPVAGWVAAPPAAQEHGAAAKRAPGSSGFVSCQICHGNRFCGHRWRPDVPQQRGVPWRRGRFSARAQAVARLPVHPHGHGGGGERPGLLSMPRLHRDGEPEQPAHPVRRRRLRARRPGASTGRCATTSRRPLRTAPEALGSMPARVSTAPPQSRIWPVARGATARRERSISTAAAPRRRVPPAIRHLRLIRRTGRGSGRSTG